MFVGIGGPGVHCQSQEMLRREDEQSVFRVSGDMEEVLDALLCKRPVGRSNMGLPLAQEMSESCRSWLTS